MLRQSVKVLFTPRAGLVVQKFWESGLFVIDGEQWKRALNEIVKGGNPLLSINYIVRFLG